MEVRLALLLAPRGPMLGMLPGLMGAMLAVGHNYTQVTPQLKYTRYKDKPR